MTSPTVRRSSLESTDAISAGALGFMPRLFALTTLPHRQPEGHRFERVNGRYSLTLEARRPLGLPHGIYPRLILVYLTTAAVRSKNPEIDLGRTPNDFARKLGVTPITGKRGTVSRLREQLKRLVTTQMSWEFAKDFRSDESGHGLVVSSNTVLHSLAEAVFRRQQPTWKPKVVLSRDIFQEITRSAVPFDLRAVQQLKQSPLAIDIYVWLTSQMSFASTRLSAFAKQTPACTSTLLNRTFEPDRTDRLGASSPNLDTSRTTCFFHPRKTGWVPAASDTVPPRLPLRVRIP